MTYPNYYMYPAIFQHDGEMWTVIFPDIDNAFTSADTLEEAIIDARAVLEDCLYFREIQEDEIPKPTPINNIASQPTGSIIQNVAAFMPPVRNLWNDEHEKLLYA